MNENDNTKRILDIRLDYQDKLVDAERKHKAKVEVITRDYYDELAKENELQRVNESFKQAKSTGMFVFYEDKFQLNTDPFSEHCFRGDGITASFALDHAPIQILMYAFTMNPPFGTSLSTPNGKAPEWANIPLSTVSIEGGSIAINPPVPKEVYFFVSYSFAVGE